MITFKEITDADQWEFFIRDHAPQSLFQSWTWGEVVKKYTPLVRLGMFDGKTLRGIGQYTIVSARRGRYMHVRHGPILADWDENSHAMIEELRTIALAQKCSFIRLSPMLLNTPENQFRLRALALRDAPVHAVDSERCWVLDLSASEEELMKQMRKTTRYLIRQAQKMGVEIQVRKDPAELAPFLELYRSTAQRHQFVQHAGILEEFIEFLKDDAILLYKGLYEGKLLSAALILFYNNQAIYHHSASIEQKIPVNYLLQWQAILEAKRRGKDVYNFWGVAPEDKPKHPWRGLSLFKRGFGGREIEYIHAKDLPLSPLYAKTYLIEAIRTKWKRYA
jgi:peptidoglycan pentaglycine glycine transferase (the first glycine)